MSPQPAIAQGANKPEPATDLRAAWDRIAPGYDENVTPTHFWLGAEGLRRAGLRPGMSVLDVAAGSGAVSIPAARLGARVLATDLSPAMLDKLGRRTRSEGLEIETRAMDGQALELDDDSFDLVGSQFGVMLFPDMPRGIREMARVAKPGGRVLVNAFGDFRKVEFFECFVSGIQAVRPGFTGPATPPLPFQLQDPKRLRDELAAAGLKDVKVDTIIETLPPATGERLWNWLVWSNPVVEGVLSELGITSDERKEVQQALDRLVRERARGGDTVSLTNPVNIGVATK
jgi:ubiquinone/menaquinone biosynthesis C-methylase UbiE